jgi:hypothetical protein
MKDRITVLPDSLVEPLQGQSQRAHMLHQQDLANGYGAVYLPTALERKYPNANREWCCKDVKTTMIYTHVLNRGPLAVRSPLDHTERT